MGKLLFSRQLTASGQKRPLPQLMNWNLKMRAIFSFRNSVWTLSFAVLGWALGLLFNFYTTGNWASGFGVLGVPLGGLVGATVDGSRSKQYSMLLILSFIAMFIWLR